MSVSGIHQLLMPKWGLAMEEGKIVAWLVEDGEQVEPGAEVVEVETEKIAGGLETTEAGILRHVASVGDMVPVAGLVGVIAQASVPPAEVDAFVAEFQAKFVPEDSQDVADAGADAGPQFIDAAGQKLRYLKLGGEDLKRGGEGEPSLPAILLHGFGGDLNNWLFNHDTLASGRAVYALDLPGHGGSSKDAGTGSLEVLTGALNAFMDAIGEPRAHLVGHSMGGAVALDFALTRPERVASLVLIAPAGLGPEIDGDYIEGFIASERRRDLKPHLQKLFADPALVNRQLIDDVLKYKRLDGTGAALRAIAGELFPGGQQAIVLRDRLADLATPVQVIWGADDRILPAGQAEGLPETIATEVIANAGHMVHMEAAAAVNALIAGFWKRVGAAAG